MLPVIVLQVLIFSIILQESVDESPTEETRIHID